MVKDSAQQGYEEVCPRCRTSNYQNKSLKLLVNECGHDVCEKCVEHLFIRGSSACPTCKVPLKKSGFKVKRFEDYTVEREVDIRKRVLKDYNKREEDFLNLRDFNNYLEEIEEIVFNLANNLEVEETKAKIEVYRKDNFKIIQKNRVLQSKSEAYLKSQLAAEAREAEERRIELRNEEISEELEKSERKNKLLDQIATSDRPADELIMLHKEELVRPSLLKPASGGSGFSISMMNTKTSAPKAVAYKYEPIIEDNYGPSLANLNCYSDEIEVTEIALAGGFKKAYAGERLLEEAFDGLLYF